VTGGQVAGAVINVNGPSPEAAFLRVVREPLEALFASGFDDSVVILIDALDEALERSGSGTIVPLLAESEYLPRGIRFILTSLRGQPDRSRPALTSPMPRGASWSRPSALRQVRRSPHKVTRNQGRHAPHCPGRPRQRQWCSRPRSARTRLRRAADPGADPAGLTARARPKARPESAWQTCEVG
jgi:hypothetical protein